MEVKSIMKIPNFDGNRTLISQLHRFSMASVLNPVNITGAGTAPGNNLEDLHELSVMRIADKNSIRLLQVSGLTLGSGRDHVFKEVELESDLIKNGKRSQRFVLSLSEVIFGEFIRSAASGTTPDFEYIRLYFRKISFKQY